MESGEWGGLLTGRLRFSSIAGGGEGRRGGFGSSSLVALAGFLFKWREVVSFFFFFGNLLQLLTILQRVWIELYVIGWNSDSR